MKKRRLFLTTSIILLSYTTAAVLPTVEVFAQNYESQIQQNKQQIEANKQIIEKLQSEKLQEEEKLGLLSIQMATTQQEVDVVSEQIQQTQNHITQLQSDIDVLNEKIAKRSEKIIEQARYLQTENNASDIVNAIFSSQSIVEAFEKIVTMVQITGASQDILVQQQKDKEAVVAKQEEVQKQLVAQGERASQLQTLMIQHEQQREALQEAVTQLQNNANDVVAQNSVLQANIQTAQRQLEEHRARVAEQQRIEQQNQLARQQAEEAKRREEFARQHGTSTQSVTATIQTPTPVAPVHSIVGSGNFPPPNPAFIAAINGGAPGNCTWYVYNRFGQLGVTIPQRLMGNANQWGAYARSYGYSVTNTPRAGTAVSFQGGVAGSSAYYGHVAFVEAVNPDGSIVVSEMNTKGLYVLSTRTISASDAARGEYINFGL